MLVSKVLFIFVSCFFISRVCAYISIDIDPDELQTMGEILVESYFTHNLIQRSSSSTGNLILAHTKKALSSTVHMLAFTGSLVGANLLTVIFQPIVVQRMKEYDNSTKIYHDSEKKTLMPSEMCPPEFGCENSFCWRTCTDDSNNSTVNSWCYTTDSKENKQFKECEYSHDCSPCWECLGPCTSSQHWYVLTLL